MIGLSPAVVMDLYTPTDSIPWSEEFIRILHLDVATILDLLVDISENGVENPIRLSDDGRVIEGRRRLLCAHILRLPEIPVRYSND